MALFRRADSSGPAQPPAPSYPERQLSGRRPNPGLLRRERRALLRVREERLRDLGGLTVEMYRRSSWRDDLLQERCAEVIGIDARLAEIDELLHGSDGTERCTSCGAPVVRSAHFCPNCGRPIDEGPEDTMLVSPGHR
jgi:hypothetical protein